MQKEPKASNVKCACAIITAILLLIIIAIAFSSFSEKIPEKNLLPPTQDTFQPKETVKFAQAQNNATLAPVQYNRDGGIENLVFAGAGVKGITYAGAITVLDEKGVLSGVKRVAGASAGSIVATILALGYDTSEITEVLGGLDLNSFENGGNPLALLSEYGVYKGATCLEWIESLIEKKGLAKDATFKDLHENGGLELHIIVTDLNEEKFKDLSYNTTPNTIVAEAVRASTSIPMFFRAWKFSNSEPDDHIYVDGVVVYNYPLDLFDKNGVPNYKTLGFSVTPINKTNDLDYNEPLKYAKTLFETMLASQTRNSENKAYNTNRSIWIDSLGVSPTDFDISKETENLLYKSGKKATEDFFNLFYPDSQ